MDNSPSTAFRAAVRWLLAHRRPLIVLLHLGLVAVSSYGAIWLRFDGRIPEQDWQPWIRTLPWLLLIRALTFGSFRLYQGLWRYTGVWDLRNIVSAVVVSSLAHYLLVHWVLGWTNYPRSVFIIDSFVLVLLMGGVRMIRRMVTELRQTSGARRVLVYGAGDAGELIVRDMRQNARFNARPIGFVDDDGRKVGQRIHGVPVLGGRDQLLEIFKSYSPEELLIAIPSASRETLRAIVRAAEPYKIRITTLPKLHDLGARVDMTHVRELKVEDLLARDPVILDDGHVRQFLERKRVIITGAGGSIGSELCRQIAAARPASLVLVDRYENGLFQIHNELAMNFEQLKLHPVIADITDVVRVQQVFDDVRPQVVFHAAAHKHVPLMEDNPCEAVKNNVRGTRIVSDAALRCGAERFVLISTDKAVNPTSVMGATKRVAELIVERLSRSQTTRFVSVRFGNVLASNGSVVPTFLAQIEKGGPVTVTHPEMRRFFMLIPEAVQLVLYAAALDDPASLYVLDMGDQVKVVDMARDLIRLSGYVPDKDIEVQFTGIRPGEKLVEELVGSDEVAKPSSLPKVMQVFTAAASPGQHEFAAALSRLEACAADGAADEVLKALCALVPSFVPTTAVTETSRA